MPQGPAVQRTKRILVADPIAEDGVALLRREADVDVSTGLAPDDLIAAIGEYNALIVRSETKVTADVFAAAKQLQAVGRAGVGVDNIDLTAATERGVIVVNAPLGNTISAAEHAVGLMLALARHIAEANASLKSGEWKRSKFVGVGAPRQDAGRRRAWASWHRRSRDAPRRST